jgi:FKBP-type peptidyl-prolyl cis-trans isomerase FkpA
MNRFSFLLFLFLGNFAGILAAPPDSLSNIPDFLMNQRIEAKKTREGLYFKIDKEGTGSTPRTGSFVKIRYTGKLLNGKIFDATTTTEKDEPFVFQNGFRQVVPGLDLAVAQLKTGGKGTFFIPNALAYGKNAVGKSIPAGAALIFEVELVEILSAEAYEKYTAERDELDRIAFEKKQKEQFETDLNLLDKYAAEKNWKVTELPSGLRFFISKNGKGEKVQIGQKVAVEYEGFLLNGNSFDKSDKNAPIEVMLGAKKVISGWEEGLLQFNKGAEGWLLLPSALAYGPMAIDEENTHVPANACLVFKIKVK